MISLKAHNVLDYIMGAFLILCPFLFGFSDLESARNVFLISGMALIVYSLCTNCYYAAVKLIPVSVHMALDVLVGLVLLFSPAIFNYRVALTAGQNTLHYVLGVFAIVFVAVTRFRHITAEDIATSLRERSAGIH